MREIACKEKIRERRLKSGLTQTEAAELVHSNLKTWQRWEYGKTNMHPAFWELFNIKAKD